MIRQGFSILAVLAMAACSTSSSNGTGGTSAVPSGGGATTGGGSTGGGSTGGGTTGGGSTGGGTTGGGTVGGGATTGSVFPVGDAVSFTRQRGSLTYAAASGTTPVTVVRTNSAPSEQATYDLTINGTTYNLMPKASNRAGSGTNSFVATVGGTDVSLFLNENAVNATIANTQISSGSNQSQFLSIVGTPTDTANLPAMATYSGNGEISMDTGAISYDDAPNTTVTFDADFTSGTLNGQFDVTDVAGDGTGTVDIVGSAILPMTGTIQGSTFSADVDYTELVRITNGLGFIKPGSITGGFYGQNADEAVGVGINLGRSAQPNDVLIYTRIQATKQ